MKKKVLSLLLVLVLVMSLLPVAALADNELELTSENCVQIGEDDMGEPVYLFTGEVPAGTQKVVFPELEDVMTDDLSFIGAWKSSDACVTGQNWAPFNDGYAFVYENVKDDIELYEDYQDYDFSGCYAYWIMDDDYDTFYYIVPLGEEGLTFTASVGATALTVVTEKAGGYTPYTYDPVTWEPVLADPVLLYILAVPDGTKSVDLEFSENVLAYNYTADGATYIAGEFDYTVGAAEVTVDIDGNNDGEPDCIQVQMPGSGDVCFAITFAPAPTFTAFVGTTEMKGVSVTEDGYTPYSYPPPTYDPVACDPVLVYTVAIPEGTARVDLKFSENVLAYNYAADGMTWLDGWYQGETFMTGADAANVAVDANEDGIMDFIVIQTPYYDGVNSLTLFAITFEYTPLFTAFAGETELTGIKKTEDGYTPYEYDYASGEMVAADPVALYTVSVPEGTTSVDLKFAENVLAYNYTADGTTWLAGEYADAQAGAATATVSVDANNDGKTDCIQVQTPYDETWSNSKVLFAITFDGGSSSGGDDATVTEAALLSGITATYAENGPGTDGNEAWVTADMMTYATMPDALHKLSDAQMETMKNNAIQTLYTSPSAGDAAKNVIALVSMGYDPTKLTAADGTAFSAKTVLDALAFTENGEAYNGAYYEYTLPYVIMAYRLFGDAASLQKLVALALEIKDAWMDTTWGVDGMTPFMVALAPDYGSDDNVKTALNAAADAVKAAQQANGSISGSAASTGLAIAGFTALGQDAHEIKNGDKSLIDGLLSFANEDATSLGSSFDTEQGLRGLVAAAKGPGFVTYTFAASGLKPAVDLSIPSVTFNIQPSTADAKLVFKDAAGTELVPASAGVFSRLAVGTYSYTITATGYNESSGTVNVSADSRETVNVSLVRTASEDVPESSTAVVTVKILSHDDSVCGGTYTYLHNPEAYESVFGDESYAVTIEKGKDTARDALIATLEHYNIPYTEQSNGYFSMINNEAEFGHGSNNSGWMYLIDGVQATVGANQYVFTGNAVMTWYYTDDYSNDYGSDSWNTPTGGGSSTGTKTEEKKEEKTEGALVKVELPAKDGQVMVIVKEDGTEEIVKKCVIRDGKCVALVPDGAQVKVVDAPQTKYGDVKDSDWFAGAVKFVTERGIFQGTDKGFEPGAPMNRAMLVTVLQRIAGEKAKGTSSFGDVEAGSWYADAVAWAADAGIVNGRGEGFAPTAEVTRAEIATMLYRFMKYLGYDVSSSKALTDFSDGSETEDWAKEAMEWAVSVGLFQGDQNGALNPNGAATRAEVATLVERLIGLMVK